MSTPPLTSRRPRLYNTSMKTHELFTDDDITRLERRLRAFRAASAGLAGAALAVCILLCALTNTANAHRTEPAVMAVSALAGWAVISVRLFGADETRRTLDHARMLRESERIRLPGGVDVTPERLRIRKSIAFRVLRSRADPERRLKVIECRSGALDAAGGKIAAVYLANGYVAAWEETS